MASQNTLVDDNVGRLLDALKETGLDENTIVIYSFDQGTYYGQHGLWTHTVLSQPSTLQETAFHIPLIVRLPGRKQGKVVDAIFYEQTETRAIRTKQVAYWKRMDGEFGPNELYDMLKDPYQRENLAEK